MAKADIALQFNDKKLKKLIKALGANLPQAKIGILGGGGSRSDGQSNAEVGAVHEFGGEHHPIRSFLRMPLTLKLMPKLMELKAFSADSLKEVIDKASLETWLEKIAVVAEDVVLGAFETGGYGHWAAWKNPDYENNTGQLLLDTQALRNSISSEVE